MYETYYDKLQPFFSQDKLQLQFMVCDSFVLSFKTQSIIEDLKNLEDLFDLSNLDENHELLRKKNKTMLVYLKLENLKANI